MSDSVNPAPIIARIQQVLGTVTDVEVLEGGRSGHTWSAVLADSSRRIAIKAGSPGRPTKGRHDMERQGRVMQALNDVPSVEVPEVLAVIDGDPQIVVTTFVDGECCEPTMDGSEHIAPAVLETRGLASARMLGELHLLDPAQLELGGEEVMSVADELGRWGRVMDACDPAVVPGGRDVVAALHKSLPEELAPRLVHGDYRLGNLLCSDTGVNALIDWEIWSVTDPRVDLGWFLLYSDRDDWPGVSGPIDGMPSAARLADEYQSVVGTCDDIDWFVAFGRMKMAAITAHNLRRHREGRRHDPTQERFTGMIVRMLERAREELSI